MLKQAAAFAIVAGVAAVLVWVIKKAQRRDDCQEFDVNYDRVSDNCLRRLRGNGLL